MELLTPKVQINTSIRTDASGEVMERSTLLNIRTDEVQEAIKLFSQLKSEIQGQDQIEANSADQDEITVDDVFPDEEKSYDWPIKASEPNPKCPDCGSRMVKRNGKNGEFWGCSQFRKGCRGTRQV
jgi:hypothetical protein